MYRALLSLDLYLDPWCLKMCKVQVNWIRQGKKSIFRQTAWNRNDFPMCLFFPSTLMLNSEAREVASNEATRHPLIGILDKHKWLPLWKLASSRLAVALGGFILCQQVLAWGLLFFLLICLLCLSVDSVPIYHAKDTVELKFWGFTTVDNGYYVEFPFTNKLNYWKNKEGVGLIKTPTEFFMNLYFTTHLSQWVAKI